MREKQMTNHLTTLREIKRGDWIRHHVNLAKVMVVADGYVMARVPRCYPFVVTVKEALESLAKRGQEK